MKINFVKILKASIAGLAAGSLFMLIIPAFLVILNISNDFAILKNDILWFMGIVLISASSLYFWYCTGLFSIFGKGTPAPIEPHQNLVSRGIYKHTRNPMYLCYFSIILGEFFVLGYILLLYYFLFIVVFINVYVIFFEEPALMKRFGLIYSTYKQDVPKWILF
ncbi:MAG: isoprenylcysteine carboxylmethyltransferase family protein [Patescibacteria group bacterium]|jgi:protein-S-isoprenylcysteine O-methyltransferase Ste14|nr:isoprenylcysteine carboxylmethyltransferase family protein [Patescibacteria group bacterium]